MDFSDFKLDGIDSQSLGPAYLNERSPLLDRIAGNTNTLHGYGDLVKISLRQSGRELVEALCMNFASSKLYMSSIVKISVLLKSSMFFMLP